MSELERTARKLGLEVRIEPFETPSVRAGGLCWVRGRQLIFLDAKASLVDQVAALAAALSEFDLEDVYLAPEARELVATARRRRSTAPSGGAEAAPPTAGGQAPADSRPEPPPTEAPDDPGDDR